MQVQPKFSLNIDYLTTVLAGWLIPGAGHWILGFRLKAVILFTALNLVFWLGQYLGDFRPVNRGIHPIFFWGQVGNGLGTIISNQLWGTKRPGQQGIRGQVNGPVDRSLPPHLNTGILFTSIAGLLNMLLILQVADPRTWTQRGQAPSRDESRTTGATTPAKGIK